MRRTLQAAAAILLLVVGLLATTAMAQPYTQSPYLDARVASGELPPLEDRLPDQPMAYPVVDEIGVHGGQFNVFAIDNFPWNALTEEPARGPLALLMTEDSQFVPDIVLDFEQSEDFRTFTLNLRPGMKWSNGDAFTSEDFTFKRIYMIDDGWNENLYPAAATVAAPDEHTVIIDWGDARPRALLDMIHWRGGEWTLFNPSNYLKTWHAEFNEDAEAVAMEEGFETWEEAFRWHYYWRPLNDANKPTTQQWMPLEFTTTARLYERNPYFHQVDAAGQQLPYVDTVLSQIVDPEAFNLKVVAGEADLAYLRTNVENFTLFKENEAAGNYVVNLIPSFQNGAVVYYFNQSHPDPTKAALFTDANFRRAMSVAINRDEINELIFQGFSKPLQFTITEYATFYQSEWGETWAQFDPDLANSMLDDLGLTERNNAGIRLMADGNPLSIVVEYVEGSFSGSGTSVQELVQEYWADVGVELNIRVWPVGPWPVRAQSMEWDLHSRVENNGEMYGTVLSEDTIGFVNEPWEIFRAARADVAAGRKALADFEGGVLPGNEPPPEIDALLDIREDLVRTVFGSADYERLATAYYQQLADNTYAIGTVGQTPLVFISRPNIGNLPQVFPPWIEWGGDLNHYSNQWYFKPD